MRLYILSTQDCIICVDTWLRCCYTALMAQDDILHMRISAELVASLDELRKREDDLPSRSEMVRRLIERAAEAQAKVVPLRRRK